MGFGCGRHSKVPRRWLHQLRGKHGLCLSVSPRLSDGLGHAEGSNTEGTHLGSLYGSCNVKQCQSVCAGLQLFQVRAPMFIASRGRPQ